MNKEQYIHIDRYGNKHYYSDREMIIRHREDGPAVEYTDGDKEWYINGEELTEEEFNTRMSKEDPPENQNESPKPKDVRVVESSDRCLVSTRKYGDPPTVAEVIELLQEMPGHLRCYFRPKYHGSLDYVDEIPLHYHGICEMEPEGMPRQVTFLC